MTLLWRGIIRYWNIWTGTISGVVSIDVRLEYLTPPPKKRKNKQKTMHVKGIGPSMLIKHFICGGIYNVYPRHTETFKLFKMISHDFLLISLLHCPGQPKKAKFHLCSWFVSFYLHVLCCKHLTCKSQVVVLRLFTYDWRPICQHVTKYDTFIMLGLVCFNFPS